MNIQAIATDLDDTLLNEKTEISEYSLKILHECIRRGIKVIPCSGRTRCSLRSYTDLLQTGFPCIGGNGTELLSPELEFIERQVLDTELIREICQLIEAHGLYAQIYDDLYFYYAGEGEASLDYRKHSALEGVAVGKLSTFVHQPSSKILMINEEQTNQAFYPILKEKFGDRIDVTFSKSTFLEIIPRNVSKGNTLTKLLQMKGISPEHAMAFGDSINDVSMLKAVKYGVAMGNAREAVKDIAWKICGTNEEDGVAHFIEDYVLGAKEVI